MNREKPESPSWRKSSRSTEENCVEVAFASDRVALRDSKDPRGPVLTVQAAVFARFVRGLR
ncbi:uncharacterized protein DUF397 [Saccharopolyspora erythraea NRRL 2338]|uniref:Uncharacterized protein n=2 Tax=Saccharopolyspora erythraea TaxID=1836 RepID=A4FFW3_SACEN|nr:DUF397 domain-containing protein [Saccharopolyspora erythraea]EQD84025.1 regulator [Saccharopolyspora erythraea D]PFG96645.1 uncharacterized protein DUF397 [Saccharopolyspora erythraea NRRL 2338]QRK93126.1 DUF397 domain-containing protein [Saccharopolyspora erythraea]CAM02938.1 hypothetical protein SACE_3664 [Saccharopolyspora erythraea NRRL 2338]